MSSCCIRQVPSGASGGRGLKGLIFFFTRKFQETSVTKSLSNGNAFIGSIVTGFSNGNSLSRVMHISFGIPLTSAEHDPPFPDFCGVIAKLAHSIAPPDFEGGRAHVSPGASSRVAQTARDLT